MCSLPEEEVEVGLVSPDQHQKLHQAVLFRLVELIDLVVMYLVLPDQEVDVWLRLSK
jgi:hypothetical protein